MAASDLQTCVDPRPVIADLVIDGFFPGPPSSVSRACRSSRPLLLSLSSSNLSATADPNFELLLIALHLSRRSLSCTHARHYTTQYTHQRPDYLL